jgi:hypothetical protein
MEIAAPRIDASLRLHEILSRIVPHADLHARLLNTLSYMEHIGATKIAKTQSGPKATFISLKHAAEEARHAFYLKKLSLKVAPDACPDYDFAYLMAPLASRQYLYRLDIAASRLAKSAGLHGRALSDLAYLLVTYAIEVRADALYPVYEDLLENHAARISLATIIAEEEGHLAEMQAALAAYPPHLQVLVGDICALEEELFTGWIGALETELG